MAKKRQSSLEDAINTFEDVMLRASLSDYFHVNRTLLSKNPKGNSVLVVVDQTLWNGIMDKPEIKDRIMEASQEDAKICAYGDDLNSDAWIELNSDELYSGKIIKINIDNLEYDLSINKALIPLKLKKSEFNNISYRVFPKDMILVLRKHFDYPLDDHSFSVIRIFQIV